MAAQTLPGGTFTMAEDLMVTRMGYGAMQLAGPHVFGPPADRDAAVAVLREAVELGITHAERAKQHCLISATAATELLRAIKRVVEEDSAHMKAQRRTSDKR
jgi:hypothetical protein